MDTEEPHPPIPGSGAARRTSVWLHQGTVEAVRQHVGERGFSAFVEHAVAAALRTEGRAALLREYEAEHGPISDEHRAAAREIWAEAQRRHHARGQRRAP